MSDFTELEPDELSRRIKAARELRGLSQTDLGERFDADGLNSSDPGRIERMNPDVPFRRAHLDALVRHLRVPERWFTEPSADEIVWTPPEINQRLETLESLLQDLQRELLVLEREVSRRNDEDDRRGSGSQ